MSVRDQERRARQAIRRSDEVRMRIDQRMKNAVHQAEEVILRAEEVRRRIEVGDVQPRPLPSLREDSIPSMKSTESIESMKSMKSAELRDKKLTSADYSEDYAAKITAGARTTAESTARARITTKTTRRFS